MQEELAKNGGKVMQTSAGRQMNSDLDELVRQLRGELDELRRQREATQQEREELLERISKLEGQKWKLGRMTVSKTSPFASSSRIPRNQSFSSISSPLSNKLPNNR